MTDDCELTWAEANVVHGFPLNKPKGYENALSEKPSRANARRRNQLPADWPAPIAMRKRNKPFRRYIYRDPDTGQEFKCWRGEALDRLMRSNRHVDWKVIEERFTGSVARAWTAWIKHEWRRYVRLRAPLANP